MLSEIGLKVVIDLLVLALLAIGGWNWRRIRAWWDGRTVYCWLRENTQDEVNESHRSIGQISAGVGLDESRVRAACRSNKKILQSTSARQELWSVWRQDPESLGWLL